MTHFNIRKAEPDDADLLTDLAKKSKAHWGYSQELIDKWQEELTVTAEFISNSISFVAEHEGKIVGFWCRSTIKSKSPTPGLLFIDPKYIRHGCGAMLWQAVKKEAKSRGLSSFIIEADPNAEGFYLKMGGIKIGEKESTVVAGRKLPIIEFNIE